MHLVLRFQSLALNEEDHRSTIHFEVEGEEAIASARAEIVDRGDGRLEVGAPRDLEAGAAYDVFASAVKTIYAEQSRIVAQLAGSRVMSCIVALKDVVTIDTLDPAVAVPHARA